MPDSGFSPSLERWDGELHAGSSLRSAVRWGLHVALFAATLLSTTVFGFALEHAFELRQPLNPEAIFDGYGLLEHLDRHVWLGLSFSLPLMTILLCHEFGHYFECRRRGLDASLPYFLPSPTLLGTLGAFIRIRSPFYTREGLFDVGISGPIAGFIALLPFLVAGVALSHVSPAPLHAPVTFGTPLLMRAVEIILFPGVSPSRILLHPMAMAALGGLLTTAINLLPVGQLDGGHILYALTGERWHHRISTVLVIVLALLGLVYWPWCIWALILFFFGRRHPLTYDRSPLKRGRLVLSGAALFMFLASICVVPVSVA
ncbi:MAG: site-2 protease family protein [Acidobacteriaceae bacterium]|nr:site-2 protease family protein [Acidobacteriaceae bacterium]MBV8569602.1 site-2 protease family protein [Acidobacteriaceae bacterium]